MTRQGLVLQVVLLIAAAGAAWWSWTREEAPEEVVDPLVLDGTLDALREVRYVTDDSELTITPRTLPSEGERSWWVDFIEYGPAPMEPPKEEADGEEAAEKDEAEEPGEAAEDASAERSVKKHVTFRGNDKLLSNLEQMSPLRALAVLGKVEESRRDDFGFDEPKARWTIDGGSGRVSFAVGTTPYGAANRYVERTDNQEAYLIHSSAISGFNYPESRFTERRLHGFSRDEADAIEVAGAEDAMRQTWVREAGANGELAEEWGTADKPGEPDEFFNNWIDKVGRLAIDQWEAPDCEAEGNTCQTVLTLTYRNQGEELGSTRVVELTPAEGESLYYAETARTDGLVKVNRFAAEIAIKDVPQLFGQAAEEEVAPAGEPPTK